MLANLIFLPEVNMKNSPVLDVKNSGSSFYISILPNETRGIEMQKLQIQLNPACQEASCHIAHTCLIIPPSFFEEFFKIVAGRTEAWCCFSCAAVDISR